MSKVLFSQLQNIEFIVESGVPKGGAAVQTFVWMQSLNQLGYKIQQLRFENDNRPKKKGLEWVELIPVYDPNVRRIRSWYSYKLPAYFKALKKAKPEYLYSSIPKWYHFYLNIFCKILSIKHIIRIPSDEMVDKRIYLTESKINALYIHLSFKTANLILAQNEYQYLNLRKKYPNKNIIKIYNPIVINNDFLVRKNEFKGYIAWMANFRHRKNMSLLFRIASQLPQEEFKIAGIPLLPLDDETEKSIKNLKKLKNVEFLGNVERKNILPFLSKAKLLLSTARYEGFSNTFLEAMCTGTPILTTYGANPDNLISEFNLGFVYMNEMEVINIIKQLNEDTYFSCSQNCIDYVQYNHNHVKLGQKLIGHFKDI